MIAVKNVGAAVVIDDAAVVVDGATVVVDGAIKLAHVLFYN